MKQIGYERLIGLGTAYAVVPAMIVEAARGLYGITREKLQAMRDGRSLVRRFYINTGNR